MSTPRKLNEIQQRTLSLSDILFTANPSNGIGGRSTLQALRDLLFQGQSTPTPLNEFSDIAQLLANTVIQTNYFALVVDATDDPAIDDEFWALYQYRSGARNDLDSYRLIGSEKFFLEGGIPEAPNDGNAYARKDLGWASLPISPPTVSSNEITFATLNTYGTFASPRTGAITASFTGAKRGIIQEVFYNNATLNIPSGWRVDNEDAFEASVKCKLFINLEDATPASEVVSVTIQPLNNV
jgi:hypothetical protein